MYIIYGKDNCPFCERAKALLTQKGLEFNYLTVNKDYTREELLEIAPEAKTFPQIWLDNDLDTDLIHIGGYTELERSLLRDEVEWALEDGATVTVVFTKSDGTERTMLCTKNPQIISERYIVPEKKTGRERKDTPGVVAVFDLEKNEWRSFRLDAVKSYMIFEEA